LRFSCRVLFFSCQNLDFFSKFLVITRFFSTSPLKTGYYWIPTCFFRAVG
jgi:hypothetical protein